MRPQEIALPTQVDSDLAVRAYIESLLFESDMSPAAVADDAAVDSASDAVSVSVSVSISDSDMPSNSAPLVEPTSIHGAEVDALSDMDFDNDSASVEAARSNPFLKQLEAAQRRGSAKLGVDANGSKVGGSKVDNRPAWGREHFRCLAFNVSGLKLAVPVQFIDGMQPLDLIAATPSLGDASTSNALILGQMKVDRDAEDQSFCTVLDTARLVMPERYDSGMKESYRYILTLKNCDWSIAVDSIGGEIGLSPQNVRWRSEHTRREWLAGTVVDKMCALIDIDLLNRQMMADAILMESDT